jgi:hypothetical protein
MGILLFCESGEYIRDRRRSGAPGTAVDYSLRCLQALPDGLNAGELGARRDTFAGEDGKK